MQWFKRKEEGQALVEFSLVLPILLILLLGILVFGQIYFSYLVIQNASRDGARYGSVLATDTEIYQVITQRTEFLDQSNMVITISPSSELRSRGQDLKVAIDYKINIIAPIWNNILPNPLTISVETVMRIE